MNTALDFIGIKLRSVIRTPILWLAFLQIEIICSVKFSLESNTTPRSMILSLASISTLFTGSAKSASQQAMRAMRVMRAIFASIFFLRLVQGLGGRGSFRARLSPNNRYKPPARHLKLESGDDPGDESSLARVLSLSLEN